MSESPPFMLLVADREVPLIVRRSARARRITLRIDEGERALVLTLPRGAKIAEGLGFARSKQRWIARRLDRIPPRVPFVAGAVVPVLGRERTILWSAEGPYRFRLEPTVLRTGGPAATLADRIEAWFRMTARAEIGFRAETLRARVGAGPGRIAIRDTSSRWGSASVKGNLNFSWRLVMAPEPVLDYVVAHEVAHLKHMNHGAKFWALVEELVGDPAEPRRWLRTEGPGLHRYG